MTRHHVYPTWEEHDTDHGADCWCEPTLKEGGQIIVHHAKTCSDGGKHEFNGTKHCIRCSQEYGHTLEEVER